MAARSWRVMPAYAPHGIGVFGASRTDEGVKGTSASYYGVAGVSTIGGGVYGEGGTYGGDFIGTRAAVRLRPQGAAGKPTGGSHLRGELLCDSAGVLWFCTASGTPGTWKQVRLV